MFGLGISKILILTSHSGEKILKYIDKFSEELT